MKKILFAVLAIAFAGFYSCDKIEGPKREVISVDTSCHFDADASVPFKKTLIMEFTGHLCGNCPQASVYLNDTVHPKYDDSLVIISVHAGYFAAICTSTTGPCPGAAENANFLTDFTNAAGNEWYSYYGIASNPKGVVDGITSQSYQSWDGAIAGRLQVPAKVRLKVVNTFNEQSRNVRACVETKFMSSLSEDYKLSVLLTEDSIVDYQEWYGHAPEYYADYVHHHVLRAAFNTPLGTPIDASSDAPITSGYNITVDPAWNADRCYVVAFVYNTTTKEVIQVEEARIK
jgi:hypothetical protein